MGTTSPMTTTRLRWRRTGTGEPLVVLHGIGTTSADFDVLTPRLAAAFEVLSVDLPGHGDSPALTETPSVPALADALEADLDALGLDRVHLLGNSLGARLALELAARHRALSVVATSPSGMGVPLERTYQGALMALARVGLRAARPVIKPLAGRRAGRGLLLAGLRARPRRASRTEALAVEGGFAEAEGFWRTLWWAVLKDVPTGMDRIDCPVILAQGTRDLLSGGQTFRYLGIVPGARFQPLLRAGHAPHSDTPDEIISLVLEASRRAVTGREDAREATQEDNREDNREGRLHSASAPQAS